MVLLPFDDCQFCDDNAGGGKGGEWGEGRGVGGGCN